MRIRLDDRRALTFSLVLTLIFVTLAPATYAQQRQQPQQQKPPAVQPGEPNASPNILVSPDEDYRIGPRDVIEVRIEDAEALSGTYAVMADGTFVMNYLRRIKAEGKTTEELATHIADGLRGRYLKDPQVIVSVKQFHSRTFFIQGSVRRPGVYNIEGHPSLLKLITVAGGLADNHGANATVIREVKQKRGWKTLDGQTPQVSVTANAQAASVEQEGPDYEFKTVNITGLLKGQNDNMFLEPGDIVNIPPLDIFYVAGEVNAPGSFQLKEGTTLRQAITLAQGTTYNAAMGRGIIFRDDPLTGKREEIKIDISQVMSGKKDDIAIMPNDIVLVPNSKGKAIGNAILKALGMGAAQRGPYRY
ncbi:MAG TPA: polysaccharide biosynthesis/export family protein [Blastocatellia bacterium]|nr:polysaccharide biosynthesis/export family protein [Blastocatellia bacterium]